MIFVPKAFVLRYHDRLIELFGGSKGLRDLGMLESALAQPEATFGGEYLHADLWHMAAAYGFHLCENHPFVDGNKRIAAAIMGAFLERNGAPLRVTDEALYTAMISVASGKWSKDQLADWLRAVAPAATP